MERSGQVRRDECVADMTPATDGAGQTGRNR
jgi:hypothetical protein